MRVKTTVELTGPFFQRDPKKTFRHNVRRMLQGLADESQKSIRGAFDAGASSRLPIARIPGDRVADHVIGRVRALGGRPWALTAVVSVNNRGWSPQQGISLMAAASRVEHVVHAFRDVASQIRSSRAVLGANLTEGLE